MCIKFITTINFTESVYIAGESMGLVSNHYINKRDTPLAQGYVKSGPQCDVGADQ